MGDWGLRVGVRRYRSISYHRQLRKISIVSILPMAMGKDWISRNFRIIWEKLEKILNCLQFITERTTKNRRFKSNTRKLIRNTMKML
jgi:hypothetical protein